MPSSRIPDRWQDYEPVGRPITGTRFIAFKVPLKQSLCSSLTEDQHFTPAILLQKFQSCGWNLGLVIDLTNTARYYDPREFRSLGIEYEKLYTEGKVVPSMQVKMKFLSIVENYLAKNPDENLLIGVHCTHGVNRTGHLVCRYMVDKLSFQPDTAISLYNDARGHKIERENYINDLKMTPTDMIKYEEYKASGCPEPKPSASWSRGQTNPRLQTRTHEQRFPQIGEGSHNNYDRSNKSHYDSERRKYNNDRSQNNGERSHYNDRNQNNGEMSHYNGDQSQYSGEMSHYNGDQSQYSGEMSHYNGDQSQYNGEMSHYNRYKYNGETSHYNDRSQYNSESSRYYDNRSQNNSGRSRYDRCRNNRYNTNRRQYNSDRSQYHDRRQYNNYRRQTNNAENDCSSDRNQFNHSDVHQRYQDSYSLGATAGHTVYTQSFHQEDLLTQSRYPRQHHNTEPNQWHGRNRPYDMSRSPKVSQTDTSSISGQAPFTNDTSNNGSTLFS